MGVALIGLYGCGGSAPAPESAAPTAAQEQVAAPAPPTPQAAAPRAAAPRAAAPAPRAQAAPPAPVAAPAPIVVDAGTTMEVTLDQSLSSKTNKAGDRFEASLAAPVMVGGTQVIPKGARVSGTVTAAETAGRVSGNASLGLTFDSITVNGRTYDIQAADIEEAGSGRGKRTAIGAGVGAAAGAVIGAIAGGGKGAAIGAGAGAGAGTAGAVFTGDRDITLPAETRLSFKLSQPLSIR